MTFPRSTLRPLSAGVLVVTLAIGGAWLYTRSQAPPPSPRAQVCGLEEPIRGSLEAGLVGASPNEVLLVPRPYLHIVPDEDEAITSPWAPFQRVPLAFYAPGIVEPTGEFAGDVALADVMPTTVTLLKGAVRGDGSSIDEVARLEDLIEGAPLKVVVTVVWSGAGWDVLELWPGDQENLLKVTQRGAGARDAVVGFAPAEPAAVAATLATGGVPSTHGIRRENQRPRVSSLAARWSVQSERRAKVAAFGSESARVPVLDVEEVRTGAIDESPQEIVEALRRALTSGGFGDDDVADLIYIGHDDVRRAVRRAGPGTEDVFRALESVDDALGRIVDLLETEVGRGRYLLVVTGDGGSPPVDGSYPVTAGSLREAVEEELGVKVDLVTGMGVSIETSVPQPRELTRRVADRLIQMEVSELVGEGVPRDLSGRRAFEVSIAATDFAGIDCSGDLPTDDE